MVWNCLMILLNILSLSKSSSISPPEVANKTNTEKKNDTQSGKAMRTLVFSNSAHARSEPVRPENG